MKYKARGYEFDLSQKTYIVGILNITPDSFSDGGKYLECDKALEYAKELVRQGADIIDIGAESSRPNAQRITAAEEKKRLMPVVDALIRSVDVPLSIDTIKADVAKAVLERGASIINDISGFKADPAMVSTVKKYDAGCVLMHMRGTPQTMQRLTDYNDVIKDIMQELNESISIALHQGINRDAIAIDPGIGFAKNAEQNNEIMGRVHEIVATGYPVLIGPSRKSFLGKILDENDPAKRIFGTAAAVALAISAGVHFIRVHDVASMRDVAKVADSITAMRRD
ncbi:MAG: dihydropteroate synthase [Candidatus Omnitrophica bacterium]|nr:dihydropteroate synthase [Candidatus Omnitrophota bacterium]